MRTETRLVTTRVGEYLGPVDWNYDFHAHDWNHGGGVNPACIRDGIATLRMLEAMPEEERRALGIGRVGMYDGWPFWRPVPSIERLTWLGAEWSSFCGVR